MNLTIARRQLSAHSKKGKLAFDVSACVARFEQALLELIPAAEQIATHVLMLSLSGRVRVGQNRFQQALYADTDVYYAAFLSIDKSLEPRHACNEVLLRAAQREQIRVIDVDATILPDSRFYKDSMHLRPAGGVLLADCVAARLHEAFSIGGKAVTDYSD